MASHRTDLCIVNMSEKKIIDTYVDQTDNYDWDGNSRPDHNFQHIQIEDKDSHCEREEVNAFARSAWYNMRINFSNGDWISFRNDEYDAKTKHTNLFPCNGTAKNYINIYQTSGAWFNAMYIRDSTTPNNSGWMTYLLSQKPDVKLNQITIPGSHDAGMYMVNNSTGIVSKEWVITQELDIYNQLVAGARYFDLRIYYDGKDYRVGHFGGYGGGWGPTLSDILNQIVNFMKNVAGKKETIILKFSHTMSDNPLKQYSTDMVTKYVIEQVKNTLGKYLYTSTNKDINLASTPLKDIAGKIIAVFDNEFTSYYNVSSGILPYRDIPSNDRGLKVYDKYSNTNSYETLYNDQTTKLQQNGGYGNDYLFLLSWTLTAQDLYLLDIRCLSILANPRLPQTLTKIRKHTLKTPNIVYIDYIEPYMARNIIDVNYHVQINADLKEKTLEPSF